MLDRFLQQGAVRVGALPAAKGKGSVIVALFPYFAGFEPGNLALFSRGRDYHIALAERMRRACEQTEALPSRHTWPLSMPAAARKAGVAFTGRHGLAICPPYGSFVFIAAARTPLILPYGQDAGFCENCGACVAACPTGALDDGFDRTRCLSHITQYAESLTAQQEQWLRDAPALWGCDLCQLACPHNKTPRITPLPEFTDNRIHRLTDGDGVYTERHFTFRGMEIVRRNAHIQASRGE